MPINYEELASKHGGSKVDYSAAAGKYGGQMTAAPEKEPSHQSKILDILNRGAGYAGSFLKGGIGGLIKDVALEPSNVQATAEITGVSPLARAVTRPAVSLERGIKGGTVEEMQKPVETPFGEVKPYTAMPPGESAFEAVNLGLMASPFFKVGTKLSAATSPRLSKIAERMYESVLKPSKALIRKAPNVVKTGLEEGIPVTKGGLAKGETLLDHIGEGIDDIIQEGKAAGKKVDSKKLYSYLEELKGWYGRGFGGEQLTEEVDLLGRLFIQPKVSKFGRFIPVEEAQEIKSGTQKMVEKFYNRISPSVENEVKKSLAHGMREEIATQVPEILPLWKRYKDVTNLDEAIESAVGRLNKKDLISLKDYGNIVAGQIVAGEKGAAAMSTIGKVLSAAPVKTNLAIWLNQIAKKGAKAMSTGDTALPTLAIGILNYFGYKGKEK